MAKRVRTGPATYPFTKPHPHPQNCQTPPARSKTHYTAVIRHLPPLPGTHEKVRSPKGGFQGAAATGTPPPTPTPPCDPGPLYNAGPKRAEPLPPGCSPAYVATLRHCALAEDGGPASLGVVSRAVCRCPGVKTPPPPRRPPGGVAGGAGASSRGAAAAAPPPPLALDTAPPVPLPVAEDAAATGCFFAHGAAGIAAGAAAAAAAAGIPLLTWEGFPDEEGVPATRTMGTGTG